MVGRLRGRAGACAVCALPCMGKGSAHARAPVWALYVHSLRRMCTSLPMRVQAVQYAP